MALIVNTDTYITIAQMNEYVSKFYATSDPLRIQWSAMAEEDQEVYLRKAFVKINTAPYTGKPANPHQVNPFPRKGFTQEDWNIVMCGQAEQAISSLDDIALQEFATRRQLQRAGVKSYKIGDLSETFERGSTIPSATNLFGLSEKAYQYLSKWLHGGYKVCTQIKRPYGILWWYPLA